MTTPRQLIDKIRAGFLIDVELQPAVREGVERIQETAKSALELLSKQLYSTETHFALELLQNADDNEYSEHTIPEVTFSLDHDRVTVSNNENGFLPEHVEAICDVGKSSKRGKAGFIGEKGIGFKSVFSVSDQPEVHSAGYHFRFGLPNEDDRLGYVVPHWIDSPGDSEAGTRIVLPLRADKPPQMALFGDIKAEVLLFLRRVRKISLDDQMAGTRRLFEKALERNQTLIRESQGPIDGALEVVREARFVVHRLIGDMADIDEENRPGFGDSEIVLAFPVDEAGRPAGVHTQTLHAFLPVRDYGFRFLIHADFILNASRQDILHGRRWNKGLVKHIEAAFLEAVEHFKEDHDLRDSYLSWIPRRGDISDPFLSELALNILQALKTCPCVRTGPDAWRRPSETFFPVMRRRYSAMHSSSRCWASHMSTKSSCGRRRGRF